MKTLVVSIKKMLEITYEVDKKSMIICIFYNLLKQLLNVFYGVYFIRMILSGLETKQDMLLIIGVLLLMLTINVGYSYFDQFYKNTYLPVFKLKVESYVNEKIIRSANSISYDKANSPDELNRYHRMIDYSAKMIIQSYHAVGLIIGLLEAFLLILLYIVCIDVFALLLSVFSLGYSYVWGGRREECKYELEKKVSSFERKKQYAKRIYYLPEYAKEMRTSSISNVIRKIYKEGVSETIHEYKIRGKKTAGFSFLELLIGDAMSVMLPITYIVIRMMHGAKYLLGDFVGITQAISTFSSDVEWMLDTVLDLKAASFFINDYSEYIDKNMCEEAGLEVNTSNGFSIVFENVKYKYPGVDDGKFALDDVSVTIKNGEKIAIVGENGSGKSTFVSLLINLLSCEKGKILLNNVDINAYDRGSLNTFYGVVSQDYHIYPVSVRDNVAINGKIDDSLISDAIHKVGLAEKISNLSDMVGKEIEDTGLELSGGERQRLALARVVANRFPLVVLDEPTSALDAITERNINQIVLNALHDSGSTLLFISHKLSTTKLVDRILVFDKGRIVEDGNHEKLMQNNGLYARMYHEQKNMYKG